MGFIEILPRRIYRQFPTCGRCPLPNEVEVVVEHLNEAVEEVADVDGTRRVYRNPYGTTEATPPHSANLNATKTEGSGEPGDHALEQAARG